jgi:hypothetical protein
MAETDTIYVRVDAEEKQWLSERVKSEEGWSQNLVISQLLRHFRSLPEQEQREIMASGGASIVSKAGTLMEREAWLQHAFGARFWVWALEEALKLAKDSEAFHAPGTWKFAQYRAAYCWLDIGIELRCDAIRSLSRETWEALFDAADWALCASITFNRRYSAGLGGRNLNTIKHPLVALNLACAQSLRAQYLVEKYLGPDSKSVARASRALNEQKELKRSEASEGQLHHNWMDEIRKKNASLPIEQIQREVITRATEAMTSLKTLKGRFDEPPMDRQFLLRHASIDADLEFLRDDPSFAAEFRSLLSTDDEHSLLKTFRSAQDLLTIDVKQEIEALKPGAQELLKSSSPPEMRPKKK